MGQGELRERLREETRDIHAALEDALDLLNPALSLDAYRRLLERFYGYYSRLEGEMRRALAVDDSPQASQAQTLAADRWKLSAIADDLKSLGATPAEIHQIPQPGDSLRLDSAAAVAGAMYVVEGSTLGGAVLSRYFAQQWGLTRERGLAFFQFYGDRTGAMWQGYLEWLTSFEDPADADRAASAATTIFRSLAAWLTAGEDARAAS
jgi:heme oxygenase (biliverdin-IX-beta and delta-forming)